MYTDEDYTKIDTTLIENV